MGYFWFDFDTNHGPFKSQTKQYFLKYRTSKNGNRVHQNDGREWINEDDDDAPRHFE